MPQKTESKRNVEKGKWGGHWKTWGQGVVRTSHTGRLRFGGWGLRGGNIQEVWEVVSGVKDLKN